MHTTTKCAGKAPMYASAQSAGQITRFNAFLMHLLANTGANTANKNKLILFTEASPDKSLHNQERFYYFAKPFEKPLPCGAAV